ncbi:hypothetical protein EVAR_31168_1 [Eumeta japonica]|uniref:Uncharacterized protein n=1 Tax=Eumeta variegata TaxID=151549 RepID=A0A4C1VZC7_EUMVA|nr:hypothetical protein EVAR_31168_1 [Eumeta japonica]
MYGCESWVWRKKNESRINAVEMRSLCSMCGVSRKDRCRNSDVRERCSLKEDVVTRVERALRIDMFITRLQTRCHEQGPKSIYDRCSALSTP